MFTITMAHAKKAYNTKNMPYVTKVRSKSKNKNKKNTEEYKLGWPFGKISMSSTYGSDETFTA